MDQVKIGKFIAAERKAKHYTQRNLADRLNISDKTVSKWECGNGFPEVSLLLPLCSELDITVNELLSGERIAEPDYKEKAEENMMDLVKEAQESKRKIILSVMVAVLTIIGALPLFLLSGLLAIAVWLRVLLIAIGLCELAMGISIACMLDQDAGAFECPECGTRFVPEMRDYVMGAHTITRRRLKCPGCGKTRFCKHVLTK